MVQAVKVLASVDASLGSGRSGEGGVLIGFCEGSDTVVLGVAHVHGAGAASQEEVEALLPAPLRVLGPVGPESAAPAGSVLTARVGAGSVRYCAAGGSTIPAHRLESNPLEATRALVRCSADVVLEAAGATPAAVNAAFDALEQRLCGSASVFVTGGAGGQQLAGDQTIASLGGSWTQAAVLRPFVRASTASGCKAPTISVQPGECTFSVAALHLDVLCYAAPSATAGSVAKELVQPVLARQLRAMRREALAAGPGVLPPLRALHFSPPGLAHHVTAVYPLATPSIEAGETELVGRRAALHAVLGLPADRPLLRVANALDPGVAGPAQQAAQQQKRLSDVHLALAPSGVVGGSVHLVQGSYDYYHYMQDRFDDSGWGCAYRSLQTICSWFQRQHYTARVPPSHREIQATLVSLGDKGADFLGSRQWIGAIELGYVLDSLLGVQSKVVTVASGAEMPAKAREIAHHFDTQGTPIMIGGGVLAYTLLGIDYNADTGEAAFLILDPHYTGQDEGGKVRAGQWVAWKRLGERAAAGGELFVAGAFYNLLCPQRPTTV